MPAIKENAKNFLISSDYPMDKVVLLRSGSSPLTSTTLEIPHNLPFTPLLGGSWSMTPDFEVTYDFYSGDFPSGNLDWPFAHEIDLSCNATNIRLQMFDIAVDSKTAYYRVYGLEPADSTAHIPHTANSGDNFVLNSDYNYMKLYKDGVATPGTDSTCVINHDLGYEPQVHGWYTVGGLSKPLIYSSYEISLEVTTTQIMLHNAFGLNISRFDYRIYLDD